MENEKERPNTINWDYNTWYSCTACGKYGHIAANCMRLHFVWRFRNWRISWMACYYFHKLDHLSKNCVFWVSTPNKEEERGKGKVNVDEICK